MANIDKELNHIKNAIYGREVRGSIHDGIKKINDESENSKQKADEAHDMMESIITEGFDNAALEANFEQKLDDKIANLQPEWTQFKNDTETQLADTEQKVIDSKSVMSDLIYKKKIVYSLPIKFEDYDNVNGGALLHPQQFFISERDERIYIQYTNKVNESNVIVIYHLSGDYDRCFLINEYGYESLHVYVGDGTRLMYINDISGTYHKYDITTLPDNGEVISPTSSVNLGYTYRSGFNPNSGETVFQRDDFFTIYDKDMGVVNKFRLKNQMKRIAIRPTNGGLPFIQSIALGDKFVYWGIGRVASDEYEGWNNTTQQGIVVTDRNGNIINTGVVNPNKMKEILENEGYIVDMLENEGICVSDSGKVYSLTTTTWARAGTPHASDEGIIIFEEFSNSPDSLNLKEISTELYGFDPEAFNNTIYPNTKPFVINNKFLHPIDKSEMESIKDFADFLHEYNISTMKVVKTGSQNLKSTNDREIEALVLFELTKVSNTMVVIKETSVYGHSVYSYFPRVGTYEPLPQSPYKISLLRNTKELAEGDVFTFDEGAYRNIEIIIGLQDNEKKVLLANKNQTYIHNEFNLSNSPGSTIISFVEVELLLSAGKIEVKRINKIAKDGSDQWLAGSSINGLRIIEVNGVF